jgi:hypothetical protein
MPFARPGPAVRAIARASAQLAVFGCVLILAGCGSPDPERLAREREAERNAEKAAARLYKVPFDMVWGALLASAADRKMQVVHADASRGEIELRQGPSATSAGERIDIRVTTMIDRSVRVEIRSRPLLVVSFARDWQRVLFGDLEQKIAPRRNP